MGRTLVILIAVFFYGMMGWCNGLGDWKEDKVREIQVGGKVMCEDCSQGWNEWVHGTSPIKGARVALLCMDEHKKVVYYASDETDNEGNFAIVVSKSIHGKKLIANRCSVRLLSSPDEQCNILTDFAGGKSGVQLTRPSQVYRDLVKYKLGPFYFTSPMCDEPDTSESGEESN